jgi:hypothetical protein
VDLRLIAFAGDFKDEFCVFPLSFVFREVEILVQNQPDDFFVDVRGRSRLTNSLYSKGNPTCPMCISTAVLIAGSVTFTGGLAAIGIKKFRVKNAFVNPPVATPSTQFEKRT